MNAATFHCLQQGQPAAGGYYGGAVDDDEDSGSEDDVIDVLSADHCTGEHSYTMQMPASMRLEEERRASESPELEAARRLVDWLGSSACRKYSAPFLEPMEAEQRAAYARVVRQPMCLSRVRAGLDARSYAGITEVVRDLRLILENCYRFFGPQHHLTKKALKLETVLEQKLALLPRELREKTTLEATTLENRDLGAQRAGRRARLTSQLPTGGESSALLQLVKAEKAAQAREERLKLREERRVEKEVAQQAAIDWEQATFGPGLARLATRWEVPQVCQFLRLSQEPLQLPETSVSELERSLLMPEKSSLLALLMTCLLVAPQQRPKSLLQHPMPYRVWNDRLRNRLQNWYRTFLGSQHSFLKVFEAHGLEEQFFAVMGDTDPMETKDFHELDLEQRLWLLKGLCDHKLGQHRRVQEWMAEQEADSLREVCLGEDRLGRRYLHFPCLAEPRLYRAAPLPPPPPPPPPTIKEEEEGKAPATKATRNKSKKKSRPVRSSSRKSSRHHRKAKPPVEEEEEKVEVKKEGVEEEGEEEGATRPVKEQQVEEEEKPEFETVATSVASLRALITSLEEEGADRKTNKAGAGAAGEQQQLLEQLRALLAEWEPQDGRFQQADAALRTRLHREWHQPDTHDTNDAEDALDSWTMHYKDELDDDQSSSDESQEEEEEEEGEGDGEGKDNTEDVQEDSRDNEGWRVLRKRKIALPNGLTDCAEDDGVSAKEAAMSQSSSQPCSQPSVAPQQSTSSSKRPEPAVPRELPGKASVPHILARSAAATLPTTATANTTARNKVLAAAVPPTLVATPSATTRNKPLTLAAMATPSATPWKQPFVSTASTPATVATPSGAVWAQPFANNQPFARLRTYADHPRRSQKVRSLLEAGITTFPDRQGAAATVHEAPPKPATSPAAPPPPVALSVKQEAGDVLQAGTQRQEDAPQELPSLPMECDELPGVQDLPPAVNDVLHAAPVVADDRGAPAVAGDAVMEDACEQQPPAQKSVLVPAVDNSGQEILLHVEYTSVDEASLGNNLQSLPLPTVPPMVQNFPAAPATTTSSLQSVSSALPTMHSFPMQSVAAPVVQDLPVDPSVVQSIPPAAPSSSAGYQDLPAATLSTAHTSVPSPVSVVQNNRRVPARRVPPWWRHSSSPATSRMKEVPPLAPITTPRKIFKSRNTGSVANQCFTGVESTPDAVADAVHMAATTSEMLVSPQQQFIGSNGSQQLVFVMPPSSPKPQMLLQQPQQPEAQVMSQELLNQLLPMAAAPPADDQQTTMLLQTTTAMQNAMQTTPLLLLTSDGRLLQVVQQPS